MPNYCNMELSGHIGRIDKREKYVDFSVAFNPGKKEDNKPAVWFNCRAVGSARPVLEDCHKGDGIVIKRCMADGWKDNNGNDRITWIVFEAEKWQKREDAPPQPEPAFNDEEIPF